MCYSNTIIRERINLCLQAQINALLDDDITITPKNVGAVLM
jgi:hypothetical protein